MVQTAKPITAATGEAGEDRALRYLQARGLSVVTRNYRCKGGEIDLVMRDAAVTTDDINETMRLAAKEHPGIIDVAEDPIVSSDVIGNPTSLLFDIQGTIKAGNNTIKTLSWYENLGHAARLLDVVRLYHELDRQQEAA